MEITTDTILAAQNRLRFRESLIMSFSRLGGGHATWEQVRDVTMHEAMKGLGANGLFFQAFEPRRPDVPPAADPCPPQDMVRIFNEIRLMEEEERQPVCAHPLVAKRP